MEKLPTEIMIMILDLLDFKSQIRLIFTTKTNKYLMGYCKITEKIYINEKVLKWPYYDHLINICVYKLLKIYPKKLQYLTFSWDFNEPINRDNIPKSVTSIKFGEKFNRSVDELPLLIKSIEFGRHFNQTVDNLPSSIESIKFGHEFNQTVDKLPSSIKNLEFDHDFNQSVEKLPSGARSYWRKPFFTKNGFSNYRHRLKALNLIFVLISQSKICHQ